MQYIVYGQRVSRDIYYFCKELKDNDKTFILFRLNDFYKINKLIKTNPTIDYYINLTWNTYVIKTNSQIKEWYEKDSWTKTSIDELQKRYQRSKFKDTLTFEEWYAKNGWELKFETTYETDSNTIPNHDKDEFVSVEGKLFSDTVPNSETLAQLNRLKDTEIKYVLRDDCHTEIIYFDDYLEIKEDE